MNFRKFFYLIESLQNIKPQLAIWIKKLKPNITEPELETIFQQLAQEEISGKLTNDNSLKTRFKELLGIEKTKQQNPLLEKAKSISPIWFSWVYEILQSNALQQFYQSIFDYFDAEKQININYNPKDLSYEKAKELSDQWHASEFQIKTTTSYTQGKNDPDTVPLSDGYFMVKVNKADERTEGERMGHCLGSKCFIHPDSPAFSLRDKNNEPHATIQLDRYNVSEIKGKENKAPLAKYSSYIVEWILKTSYGIDNIDELVIDEKLLIKLSGRLGELETMAIAAREGFEHLIKLMLEKGVDDRYNAVINNAIKKNQKDIVELLLKRSKFTESNYKEFLALAAAFGHKEMVEILLLKSPKGILLRQPLLLAAYHNYKDIVELLLPKVSSIDIYNIIFNNLNFGQIEAAKLLLPAIKDVGDLMRRAVELGYVDLVKLLLPKATKRDIDLAKLNARRYGNDDIVELLNSKV